MPRRAPAKSISEPEVITLWSGFVNSFAAGNVALINKQFPTFTEYFGAGVENLRRALYGPHFYHISGRHTRGTNAQVVYAEWNNMIWDKIKTFVPPER